MPSIVGQKPGNQTYYYLVESARVDGKLRMVDQQYLGSAEEVLAKLAGVPEDLAGARPRVLHFSHLDGTTSQNGCSHDPSSQLLQEWLSRNCI